MNGILRIRKSLSVLLMVLLVVLLNACGGDGGLKYTGKTGQAIMDEGAAAKDISEGAYQFGKIGVVTLSIAAEALLAQEMQLRSNTIPGDCPDAPGRVTYTTDMNELTGDFSGTLNFYSYCSEDIATISGKATFSGKVDLNAFSSVRLNITFDELRETFAEDSFVSSGAISYDYDETTLPTVDQITVDLLIKEISTGQVYWVNQYTYSTADDGTEELTGTFYDPNYGYVVLSTETPFVYNQDDDYFPSEGVLLLTGGVGSAGGATKARLTMLSSARYQVVADTDGDDLYDWYSGISTWRQDSNE